MSERVAAAGSGGSGGAGEGGGGGGDSGGTTDEQQLGVWAEDGTPQATFHYRCCLDPSRVIRGPVVLSKEKGAVVLAFSVHLASVHALIANMSGREPPNAIEAAAAAPAPAPAPAPAAAAAAAGKKKKPKKGKGGDGEAGGHLLPRFESLSGREQAMAGEWVDASRAGQSKCFCARVALRHDRPGREEEMMAQALVARKKMFLAWRKAHTKVRIVHFALLCREKFEMASGNYLPWYEDEELVAEYYGETREGIPHGEGYKVWCGSGHTYYGPWLQGKEQTSTNGLPGTYTWPDGKVYTGTFQKGFRQGRGVKVWGGQKGSYDGEFARGLEHGLGKRTYRDGSVYEGRFRYGVRDGEGCLTRSTGEKRRGTFRDPPLDDEGIVNEGGMNGPQSPGLASSLAEQATRSLLALATDALATAVAERPELYSARTLQRVLPAEKKARVAASLVARLRAQREAAKGTGADHRANRFSEEFLAAVPGLAWSDAKVTNVGHVRLTKRDLGLLVYFLDTNDACEELCLPGCRLDAATVATMGKVLTHSPQIRLLDLSWNKIGKSGAAAVAHVLARGCKGLRSLLLAGCGLGPNGAELLADMLRTNTTLTALNLSYNGMGPLGGEAMGAALALNTALTEIDLRGNELGSGGGHALAKGLVKNAGKLKVAKVTDNHLGEAAAAAVAASLRGTALRGLESFGHRTLQGPHCISGTLGHARRRRRGRGGASGDGGDGGGDSGAAEGGGAANSKLGGGLAVPPPPGSGGRPPGGAAGGKKQGARPPAMPGLRLVHQI